MVAVVVVVVVDGGGREGRVAGVFSFRTHPRPPIRPRRGLRTALSLHGGGRVVSNVVMWWEHRRHAPRGQSVMS